MRSFASVFGWVAVLIGVCTMAALAAGLTDEQQRRVAALEGKLLAPCCYTEPVGRHQSEVALRMRLEIAKLVGEGKSESEIVSYYVQLYGQKVVSTYVDAPGWAQYVPWLLTAAGCVLLGLWIRVLVRRHAATTAG